MRSGMAEVYQCTVQVQHEAGPSKLCGHSLALGSVVRHAVLWCKEAGPCYAHDAQGGSCQLTTRH
jgi:hypothetical protein